MQHICTFQYYNLFQVEDHIAECLNCGSRKVWLLLSAKQREAISKSSPLKILSGPYGSGKVMFCVKKNVNVIPQL